MTRILSRIAALLLALAISADAAAQVRPVYVIVHRANDLDDIQDAIVGGGNGIEIDLQLCEGGTVWKVHHDNCSGDVLLVSWLLSFQLNPKKTQIALLNFDIKADVTRQSPAMVKELKALARAFTQGNLLTIYSVGDWDNRSNLSQILGDLHTNEAVAIDFSDGATWKQKVDYFSNRGVTNQFFADGIYAGLNTPSSVFTNVRGARSDSRVKLVYSWTFESESSIEEMLIDEGLDGVLVNDCRAFCVNHLVIDDGLDNAKDVLEDHRNKIRLATRNDIARWGLADSTSPSTNRGPAKRRAENEDQFRNCKQDELSRKRKGLKVTFECMTVAETAQADLDACRKEASDRKRRGLPVTKECQ